MTLKWAGKIQVYSEQDLLIEPTKTTNTIKPFEPYDSGISIRGAITEFRVTRPRGVVYIFNVLEASVTYSDEEVKGDRPTSMDCDPELIELPYVPLGSSFDGEAYTAWYPNGESYSVIDLFYEDEFLADMLNLDCIMATVLFQSMEVKIIFL